MANTHTQIHIQFVFENWRKGFEAFQCHWSQFTSAEMDELWRWLKLMNNDTIYLRPFVATAKISHSIVD